MATVRDPRVSVLRLVERCRSCHKSIYWGVTNSGKHCPYDVTDDGEATEVSHFTTCPDAGQWSKGRRGK